ncbi:MAG: hypothetical protein HDQ88_02970 [Clostridia bacterium]|nr:hypothetical protein [Clostridia bacterium]
MSDLTRDENKEERQARHEAEELAKSEAHVQDDQSSDGGLAELKDKDNVKLDLEGDAPGDVEETIEDDGEYEPVEEDIGPGDGSDPERVESVDSERGPKSEDKATGPGKEAAGSEGSKDGFDASIVGPSDKSTENVPKPVDVIDDGLDGSEGVVDDQVDGSFEAGDTGSSDEPSDPLDDVEDFNEGFEPSEPVKRSRDSDPERFSGVDVDFEAFEPESVEDDLSFLTDDDLYEQETVGKEVLFAIDPDEVPEVQIDDEMADVPADGLTEDVVREQVAKRNKGPFSLFGKKNMEFVVPDGGKAEEPKETDGLEFMDEPEPGGDAKEQSHEDDAKPKKAKMTRAERKAQRKHDIEVVKAARAALKNKNKPEVAEELDESPKKAKKAKDEVVEAKPNKKKKKNGMAQVFSESVVEAVWPDFLENENFLMDRDGETVAIAMFFDTNSIGGFNKKSRNDESKGSIIEAITSGMLKHLLTERLMDDECIVFVPCAESMSVIMEHSILYNADYTICFVYENGSVELTNVVVKASEIERLIRDELDAPAWLLEKLPEDEIIEQQVEDAFDDDDYDEDDDEPESVAFGDEDMDFGDEDDFGQDDMPAVFNEEYEEPHMSDEEPEYEYPQEEFIDGDDGEEEQEVIPYDAITETIVKTFYPTDLDLKISTEPFDGRFVHGNPYVPFEEVRATKFDANDTYIDTAISELVKDCNTQLQALHDTNLFKLRGDYFKLVSMACARISKSLDIDDPDTEVGQMQILLDESYEEKKANLENDIQARKEQLEKEWHDKVEKAASDAAEIARKAYRERYRRAHDDMIAHVQPNMAEELETYYKTEGQKIHDKRRHDAEVSLNEYVEEILNRLDGVYKKMLDEESQLRARWRNELKNYIEEHRKSEFARTQALAEELSQVTKADVVRREMSAEVDKIRASFAADREQWISQTEATHRKHIEELQQKDQLFEDTVQKMNTEKAQLEGQIDSLNRRLDSLSEVKDREYKSSLNQAKNEALSWKSEFEHQREKHRKQNVITAALAIIAILAALSIGFIGGAYVNLKADRVSTTQSIFDEIDDRLAESSLIESED